MRRMGVGIHSGIRGGRKVAVAPQAVSSPDLPMGFLPVPPLVLFFDPVLELRHGNN